MSPANANSPLREGDVVAGKYRVERVLGAGGMGVVVAAHHILLDERVALKFLLPEALASAEAIGRFIREARAATRIKSEHVARVTDVGQLEDGSPFIVMEYLEGGDLSSWLTQRGPMAVEQAVDFVLQACEAIAEAHRRGIVHRDLKPANLFCITKPDGSLSIKVLDFGISKVTAGEGADHKLTKTSTVIGSPVYMSPEQMRRSREVDARTDIWSLGVILFELLTARTPFDAETVPELVIKVATEPPPPLRTLLPHAPAALEAALSRCLEKDRDRRFHDVGEMALALQPFGTESARKSAQTILGTLARLDTSGASSMAPEAGGADGQPSQALRTSAAIRTDLSWAGKTSGTRTRRRAAVGVAGAIGLVVVAVTGALLVHLTRRPEPAADVRSNEGATSPGSTATSLSGAADRPPPSSTAAAASSAVPSAPPTSSVARPAPAQPSALPSAHPPARPGKHATKSDDDRLGI